MRHVTNKERSFEEGTKMGVEEKILDTPFALLDGAVRNAHERNYDFEIETWKEGNNGGGEGRVNLNLTLWGPSARLMWQPL